MGFFEELDTIINKVVEMLFKDKELLELIAYPEKEIEKEDLIMKNIFLVPRVVDAVSDEKTFLNVYIEEAKPFDKNSGFNQACLCFDIMCHLNIWLDENNKIRPYLITQKIDNKFNSQFNNDTREISINAPFLSNWKVYRFGEFFYGYKLKYYISIDSNLKRGKNG